MRASQENALNTFYRILIQVDPKEASVPINPGAGNMVVAFRESDSVTEKR
jgi:hypothetical protein